MDYNQDASGNFNNNMERKLFYKWQWVDLRKTGSNKKYLEEKK